MALSGPSSAQPKSAGGKSFSTGLRTAARGSSAGFRRDALAEPGADRELFQKDVRTVNEHLQNIYAEGEIEAQATIRKFRIVRREGSREVERAIEHYNLDAILAVGYRVRSERGTQFRRWATAVV
jgi:hypothetical protein